MFVAHPSGRASLAALFGQRWVSAYISGHSTVGTFRWRSAIAEVYPRLCSFGFATDGRTGDQHDAYSIAAWLRRADHDGSLAAFLKPVLTPSERTVAQVEGWILGVPGLVREPVLDHDGNTEPFTTLKCIARRITSEPAAVKQLDNQGLDRLQGAAIAEQRRRGRKPAMSVETPGKIEAAAIHLTPGKVNAVRAACGFIWMRFPKTAQRLPSAGF